MRIRDEVLTQYRMIKEASGKPSWKDREKDVAAIGGGAYAQHKLREYMGKKGKGRAALTKAIVGDMLSEPGGEKRYNALIKKLQAEGRVSKRLGAGGIQTRIKRYSKKGSESLPILTPKNKDIAAYIEVSRGKKKTPLIALSKNMKTPEYLLHEYGHATGSRYLQQPAGISEALQHGKGLGRYVRGGQALMSGRALRQAYKAKTKEEFQKAERANREAAAANTALSLPLIAEEGRASARAIGYGRKFGVPLKKMQLARALGTYVAPVAAVSGLPYLANRAMMKYRRDRLKKKGKS